MKDLTPVESLALNINKKTSSYSTGHLSIFPGTSSCFYLYGKLQKAQENWPGLEAQNQTGKTCMGFYSYIKEQRGTNLQACGNVPFLSIVFKFDPGIPQLGKKKQENG